MRDVRALLPGLPAIAGLSLFFVAPVLVFVVYSLLTAGYFSVSGPLTLDSYSEALSSEVNRRLAWNSVVVGSAVGAITVAVALPVAYWIRYCAGRLALPLLFLVVGTIFASYLVRIFAWRSLLGSNGVINSGLDSLGLVEEPLGFLLFSRFAVIVALVHIALPYVVLVLYAALRPLEPRFLEAAEDLGANAFTRWRRVVLPAMAAPAASAFLFVFVLSAADYVTPQLLGSTKGGLLGVQIQNYFKTTGSYALGAALSVLMLTGFLLCSACINLGLRLLKLDRVRWGS